MIYPASNVIVVAQDDREQPPAADAATSPNPLTNTDGGWQAVENAGRAGRLHRGEAERHGHEG